MKIKILKYNVVSEGIGLNKRGDWGRDRRRKYMAYIYAIYTNIRHAVENTRYGIRYAYRGSGVRMEWT